MARRNPLRSLLAASLLALPATVVMLAGPAAPAGASTPDTVCNTEVTLKTTGFDPPTVWARPGEIVCFRLGPGVDTNHTVTLEAGRCMQVPNQLCEKNFDNYQQDPGHPPAFRFSAEDTYPYYDRIAYEAGNDNVRGRIIVTNAPPPTTTTIPPTTTTTVAPAAHPTTTTTAAGVRPFVMDEPAAAPTTTTTAPAHLSVVNLPSAPAKPAGTGASAAAADNAKAKGKAAAGPATTTTTAAPATTDASVLDQAALIPSTPLPAASVTPEAGPPVEDVTSAAADLLHTGHGSDGDTRLMVVAIAGLAVFLLGGGVLHWFRRSSRYFPA